MNFRILAPILLLSTTALAAPELYFYDMTALNKIPLSDTAQAHKAWDDAHLVSSLQGIVNQKEERLFVRFMPHPDDFWWKVLQEEKAWLAGRDVVTIKTLEELLQTFSPDLAGVVTYDERVWATSNIASTIAGVEKRICLRYDENPGALYQKVMHSDLPFVKNELRLIAQDGGPMFTGKGTITGTDLPSSGSTKCDAYLWAKQHYLDTGKCSREFMAFYIDQFWLTNPTESGMSNATLTNHDFFIANKAFFFDLHVWEEEAPVDDPDQAPGTDVKTLRAILYSMNEQAGGKIIHIGGFTPWAWKYTNHRKAGSAHGPVDTEWKYAQLISSYNGIMDADALGYSGMANASFYQHHPLDDHYPQNPKPTRESLQEKGLILPDGGVAKKAYMAFYMGDYDAAAWLNYHIPLWWQDEAHGDTICNWAFNPNLDKRAPHALHYARSHQSANDWFIFGDSGAGYLNPGMLMNPHRDSGLPEGLDAWVAHCLAYGRRYDLSITGFIIDGHSPGMGERGMDAYATISPDGIVGQKMPVQGLHKGKLPFVRMKTDLYGSPQEAGKQVASLAGLNAPKFMFIRTILKSPSWHRDVMAAAQAENDQIEFVDPYTFFLLLREQVVRGKTISMEDALKTVSFTASDGQAGLRPVMVADGPFSRTTWEKVPVLSQPATEPPQYLYFEAEDRFAGPYQRQAGLTAQLAVTLWDESPGTLRVHYDAHTRGAYRETPPQPLTGEKKWVTLRFDLPDAAFTHGENSGADFRLLGRGMDMYVRKVLLTHRK